MTRRLFVAEKRDAGQTLGDHLARASGVEPRKTRMHWTIGNDTVCWLRGHVLELYMPEDYDGNLREWRRSDLPIIPDRFMLKETESGAAHIEHFKTLLKQHDVVVGFGDPDQEGQLIQDELFAYVGLSKPVLRLWSNALDDTSLSRALADLKPNAEFLPLYHAGLARMHADWLYGINMTRAVTHAARTKGASGFTAIGRVQTPTLALVVRREDEIRKFSPTHYYVPWIEAATAPGFKAKWQAKRNADDQLTDPRVDEDGRLLSEKDAEFIAAAVKQAGKAVVRSYVTEKHQESPPLPFSQPSLARFCGKVFNLPLAKTDEIAQALYLKKLISYPRVDTEYLKESQFADAASILSSLSAAVLPASFSQALLGAKPSIRSRAWNDKKVSGHHGIIPVHLDNPEDLDTLSDDERKVYLEIVRRYILQFWPPAQYLQTTVTLSPANETFVATGKRHTDEGWRKAFSLAVSENEDDDAAADAQSLPALVVGQAVPIKAAGFTSEVTKPPKRFTDTTLSGAMERIHEFVTAAEIKQRLKDSGLGTPATRSAIIDSLIKDNYISRGEKRELIPTSRGEKLIRSLPTVMTLPDLTAMWQTFISAIQSNQATYESFIAKQADWLRSLVDASDKFFENVVFERAPGEVMIEATEFRCTGTEERPGCGSSLRRIHGKYGVYFGCSNRACNKTFDDDNGNPKEKPEKSDRTAPMTGTPTSAGDIVACPACGEGQLRRNKRRTDAGYFWGCTRWKDGCKAAFNDVDGDPDLTGKSTKGGKSGRAETAGGGAVV